MLMDIQTQIQIGISGIAILMLDISPKNIAILLYIYPSFFIFYKVCGLNVLLESFDYLQ